MTILVGIVFYRRVEIGKIIGLIITINGEFNS
jgi:hypothetical protein